MVSSIRPPLQEKTHYLFSSVSKPAQKDPIHGIEGAEKWTQENY